MNDTAQIVEGGVPVENDAVDMIVQFEESGTFAPRPQRDPVGNWEIGYGSIWDWRGVEPVRVTADTPEIDEKTAQFFLRCELRSVARTIADDVQVPMTPEMVAALESFIYNVGAGNFEKSALLRYINAGRYADAAAELEKWDLAGGHIFAGLLRRRQAETAEFLTPPTFTPPA